MEIIASRQHIYQMFKAWAQICEKTDMRCPMPHIFDHPCIDGNTALILEWYNGRFLLRVDVFLSGRLHWLFRDWQSLYKMDGIEEPISELSEQFFECLKITGLLED